MMIHSVNSYQYKTIQNLNIYCPCRLDHSCESSYFINDVDFAILDWKSVSRLAKKLESFVRKYCEERYLVSSRDIHNLLI